LKNIVRNFWYVHGKAILQEKRELGRLIFNKHKHPVPSDLWIAGEGVDQCVSAVVSEQYVLQQLMAVVVKREEWLENQGLPQDFQMRDGFERQGFLQHCKAEYHAEPRQQSLQARDAETSSKKVKSGKHSRWSREMQRRLGTKALWEVVSFTGNLRAGFLAQVNNVDALQLDVPEPDSREKRERKHLQAKACTLRWDLRYAEGLDRKRTRGDKLDKDMLNVLKDYDSGKLRELANDATEAWGHGRIKKADGTYVDIGPTTGGRTRSFLDHWVPPLIPDSESDTEIQLTADTAIEEEVCQPDWF